MRPPEEVRRGLIRQWLARAEEDFGLAEHLVSEGSPYLGAVGFHSQQAAEKFFKAVLVRHQVEFPKTHNLGELLDLVAKVDSGLAQSLQEASVLNPYGVEIRYPGDFPEMTINDAKAAVSLAEKVRDAARAWLSDYLDERGT